MPANNLIAIDIETSGLDRDRCAILEFGAIHVDSGSSFRRALIHPDGFHAEAIALGMNAELLREIGTEEKRVKREKNDPGKGFCYPCSLGMLFNHWVTVELGLKMEEIQVLGKNYGAFDFQFLRKLENIAWPYRSIDVGSLFAPLSSSGKIPNLQDCLKIAGIDREVQHGALSDCQDCIDCYNWIVSKLFWPEVE